MTDYKHGWAVDYPAAEWPVESCASEESKGMYGWKTNCQDDMAKRMLEYIYGKLDHKFVLKERDFKWESKG